jgi:hypothetical protein
VDAAPREMHAVVALWSGCTSPHHPREAPLDEEIMAVFNADQRLERSLEWNKAWRL